MPVNGSDHSFTPLFMPWPVSDAEMGIWENGYQTWYHDVSFFEELMIKWEDVTHIFRKPVNNQKVALGQENQRTHWIPSGCDIDNPRSSLTVASWGFQWSYKQIICLPTEAVSLLKAKPDLLHVSPMMPGTQWIISDCWPSPRHYGCQEHWVLTNLLNFVNFAKLSDKDAVC